MLAPQGERPGQAVGVGQRGRGVRVFHQVVRALGAAGIAGQAPGGAQPSEAVPPPGEQFVHISLVAGVPHDRVARGLKDPVQRDGQLHDAEVGPEMPPGARHRLDQQLPDLIG